MDTLEWAREQRAMLAKRRKTAEAEIRVIDKIDAHYAVLLGESVNALPRPTQQPPRTHTTKAQSQKRDSKRNGQATKHVLEVLSLHGPLSMEGLINSTGRTRTGLTAITRIGQQKGTIAVSEIDGVAMFDVERQSASSTPRPTVPNGGGTITGH